MLPFEIRPLKKGHTEQRRTRSFYIAAIVRHRGTIDTWSIRGYLRVLLMFWSISFWNNGLQDVLFITKAISNTYTTPLSLFVPSRPLCSPLFVCLLYVVGLFYHSIFRKKQKRELKLIKTFVHCVILSYYILFVFVKFVVYAHTISGYTIYSWNSSNS